MTHIDLENFKEISANAKNLYCEDIIVTIDETCSRIGALV